MKNRFEFIKNIIRNLPNCFYKKGVLNTFFLFFILLPFYAFSVSENDDYEDIVIEINDVCFGEGVPVYISGLELGISYEFKYELIRPDTTLILSETRDFNDSTEVLIIHDTLLLVPGNYQFRIDSINQDDVSVLNLVYPFTVHGFPEIVKQPAGVMFCRDDELFLSIGMAEKNVLFQWEIKEPGNPVWFELIDDEVYQGVNDSILYINFDKDYAQGIDSNLYRAKVFNRDNISCYVYSDSVLVIVDTIPPEFVICPEDTIIYLDPGECEGYFDLITYATLNNLEDNCEIGGITPYRNDARGLVDSFKIGITSVTLNATDWSNNKSVCRFEVHVIGPPSTMDCPQNIEKMVDPGKCGAYVDFPDPYFNNDCVEDINKVKFIFPDYQSGDFFPVGTTVVPVNAKYNNDIIGTCDFMVTIEDTIHPVFSCPNDTTVYTEEGKSTAVVFYDTVTFKDNCLNPEELIEPAEYFLSGSEFPKGVNHVVWKAIEYGISYTCEFNIIVVDEEAPKVTCPDSIEIILGKNICDTILIIDQPIAEDNDSVISLANNLGADPGSEYMFPVGETQIIWEALDADGNFGYCSYTINVKSTPFAFNDSVAVNKNDTLQIFPVQNDLYCAPEDSVTSMNILEGPFNGSASVVGTDTIEYIPAEQFTGNDSILYKIYNSNGLYDSAWIQISVIQVYIPIVLIPDTMISMNWKQVNGNVLDNDTFTNDCEFTFGTVENHFPDHAVLFVSDSTGFVEYKPEDEFIGIDTFSYFICDYLGICDTVMSYFWVLEDSDNDNVPNLIDIDNDNDGIPDEIENTGDSDGDGLPDYLDIDSDNDGIVDNIEAQSENGYVQPSGIDSNSNGLDDAYDPAAEGFSVPIPDYDNDLIPDFIDNDSDNDLVPDQLEGNDGNSDGIMDFEPYYSDADGDGLDDAYDTFEGFDLQFNGAGTNVPLQDTDQDLLRDWRDDDDDGDDKLTEVEDINNNGIPGDDDTDLDGLPDYLDAFEACNLLIPDGFSPNADGVADLFYVKCIHLFPDAKMIIYNRWGQKVFEKENYGNLNVWDEKNAFWDGTSNVGLQIIDGVLPSATYLYILDLGDGSEVLTGTVFLNRKADTLNF